MNFKEWFDYYQHDFFNYPEEAMESAWNKAIDEAAKVAEACVGTADTYEVADEIKKLKG